MHEEFMGQPEQPQPQEERPFFLLSIRLVIMAATISRSTRQIIRVAMFCIIHVIIKTPRNRKIRQQYLKPEQKTEFFCVV